MSGNQLPVLSLDFSDEKIKALQDIAEKFKTGFSMGPGGFPVTSPRPIPGDNHKPTSFTGTGAAPGNAALDKFMKSLGKDADSTLKTFTLINKTLKITTSELKDLFTTTIFWGTKIAALAVGGPFGYDMMARHVGSQLMNAQGLNMTFGQKQAASSVYGTRFSATNSIEQMLATAQANPNSPEYKEALALHLDPKLGAAENLPKFFDKINQLHRQYGGNTLAALHGMGINQIGTADINQVVADSPYLPLYAQQFGERSRRIDSEINPNVMRGFQDTGSHLMDNGQQIYDTFLTAVSRLNPAITGLSDTLTNDIKGFLGGPNGKALFTDISAGLKELGSWLKSDQFKTDLTDFEKSVKEVADAVGNAAKWILKIPGIGDDKSTPDNSPSIMPWLLGGLYGGFKLGGVAGAGWGAYAGYLYGDRQNIGDSAKSSWDFTKQNIGNGLRWAGFDTDYGLPGGTVHGSNIQSDIPGTNISRGIRNNNPGNLKFAHQRGATLEDGPDASHAKFATMAMGLSALDRQVELYIKRGRNTIDGIFDIYATGNKAAYKSNVMKAMGIGLNDKIDSNNEGEMIKMLRAIITQENGSQANQIPDTAIRAAYDANRPQKTSSQQEVLIKILNTPGSDFIAQLAGMNQIPH